uniref:Reverse transcriptase domain-containing protein n=1 Tax=Leptobrachium leishanense TaxID=445787 RepID=A0A8C5M9N9_9ANUR
MEKMKIGKKNNLSKKEREALDELREDDSITIKPADKGGGIVILNTERYEEESLKILNDPETYIKLRKDPTEDVVAKFHQYLDEGEMAGILNDKEHKYLKILHPQRPTFYHLPKVHKDPVNPPGRPIISGIDSISSRVSEYIDKILQPIVLKTKYHLKDTLSAIQELEKISWQEDYILVTCDVKSLYSNIPHKEGMESIKRHLEGETDIPPEQKDFTLEGIKLILENNYFSFNKEFYLQKKGTAMGTRFAPSFANLYMSTWEEKITENKEDNIILYLRYIDDILMIWKGGEEDLVTFLNQLNTKDPNIKLESTWNRNTIDYLDLTIFSEGNKLYTKTYFKKVDTNSYIHRDSCHLRRWLEGIPKSQYLRIKRNCSKESDFNIQTDRLKTQFLEKGYEESRLESTKNEIALMDRKECLKYKNKINESL